MGKTKVTIKDSEFLGSCKLLLTVHSRFLLDCSSSSTSGWKEGIFVWSDTSDHNFETLKDQLTLAPLLSLLEGHDDFMVYSDADAVRQSDSLHVPTIKSP